MSKSVSFSGVDQEHEIDIGSNNQSDDEDGEASRDEGRQFNKFELLGMIDGTVAGSDQEDEYKNVVSDADSIPSDEDADGEQKKASSTPQSTANSSSNKKRKPRKKRGKKNAKKNDKNLQDPFDDEDLEDLTKAIVLHSTANENRDLSAKYKQLKIDMRNLIPESELKRMFGKSVIKEDRSNRRPPPGSNFQRSRFVSSGYFEVKSSSAISTPKMDLDETINNFRRSKLSDHQANQCGTKTNIKTQVSGSSTLLFNSDEPVYFRFVHDQHYQEAQKVFLQAVNQGDTEIIVQNLTAAPYHAESLVQLSHMVRVSEDYKTASECIERALIVFEKGFHPRFNVATATCRLSYKRPENRTFFITIFKHINYCHRRGLRRTPFEYCKLLLSLEPENDPLLAVQMLDFYAIRSEEYDYLIDFYSQWTHLQKLPNLSFSRALAHFLKSRNNKQSKEENTTQLLLADRYLQEALIVFPNFIIPLLDACAAEPDTELKKCNYFDYTVYSNKYKSVPETVDVLINLYVKRSYSLWKQKHVILWLERNVAIMVKKFDSGELTDEGRHFEHWHRFPQAVPKNLLRHIVLCDLDMKIPSSASTSTFLDIDPYPPTDSLVSYDVNKSSDGSSESSSSFMGGISGLFLRSFLPSFSLNDQQQPPVSSSNTTNNSPLNQTTSRARRGQQSNRAQAATSRAGANSGSQITLEDYVLDEDFETDANQANRNQQNDLHNSIQGLVNSVTRLVQLQPLIRAHQERHQDPDGSTQGRTRDQDDTNQEGRNH